MLRLLEQLKRENLPIQHSIKRIASQWMSLIAWHVAISLGRSPPSRVHLDEGWYNAGAVIAPWDTLTC
jgi:hypothetical protein